MTSTQPKYFLNTIEDVAKTSGIAGILCDPRCCDFPVRGGGRLFTTIPNTDSAMADVQREGPSFIRELSANLRGADKQGPGLSVQLIAGTCAKSFYGNRAVYGLAYKLLTGDSGLNIEPSPGYKHAVKNAPIYISATSHGSNINSSTVLPGYRCVMGGRDDHIGEHAVDYIKSLCAKANTRRQRTNQHRFASIVCSHSAQRHLDSCASAKDVCYGKFSVTGKETCLVDRADQHLHLVTIRETGARDFRCHENYSRTYIHGNTLYWVCRPRQDDAGPPRIVRRVHTGHYNRNVPTSDAAAQRAAVEERIGGNLKSSQPLPAMHLSRTGRRGTDQRDGGIRCSAHTKGGVCYVLGARDRSDLYDILLGFDHVRTYRRGRLLEIRDEDTRIEYEMATKKILDTWLEICREAGESLELSNNVGTLLDQVVWIGMAQMAGNKYYDHARMMREKAQRKVPQHVHYVDRLVDIYHALPIDARVDLFGINKLSVYPQLCGYSVVEDQLEHHMSPLDCDFSGDSPDNIAKNVARYDMYTYMRYLYIRIFFKAYAYYPGNIRNGVEAQDWHVDYKVKGVPSDKWRESRNIDLTRTLPHGKPDMDTYLGLADSSCAPSRPGAYASALDYRNSPSYDKRKLLYLLQAPEMHDIAQAHQAFVELGEEMGQMDISYHESPVDFSTSISTGIRFERQKPNGRPFYQVSTPFGCLLSNGEATVRSFLRHVPQSLMSMTLKDRGEEALRINSMDYSIRERVLISDDKEKYSPHMDPQSQQLTADFFAEVTGDPAFKSLNNTLLTNSLYYRVHGTLVHYPSNGTDREGLRGAQNTWTEVVCHGYHTRCLRERDMVEERTRFIGFIDDALRRYEKTIRDESADINLVHEIVADLEEKLALVGRKLSWDKAYVSEMLSTILGEIYFVGIPLCNGLKSYVHFCEVEEKLLEDVSSHEANFASKAAGAMAAGCPDLCAVYSYVHNTLKAHHRYGVRIGDGMSEDEYALWCMTPLAFGGAGMRGPIELKCTESGSRTTAGVGNLIRLVAAEPELNVHIDYLLNGDMEPVSDLDFLRDPSQFHVKGARVKTQRLQQWIRRNLESIATSAFMRSILRDESARKGRLLEVAARFREFRQVDVQEVKNYYNGSSLSTIDSIISKICNSDTAKSLISPSELRVLRGLVREDARTSSLQFRERLGAP